MWSSLIKSGGDVRSLAERLTRHDDDDEEEEASQYESESYQEDGEVESQTTYDDDDDEGHDAHQADPNHQPVPPGTPSSGLLGGLSRLLETMAPPPPGEEDGWGEDDDYIDDDDDDVLDEGHGDLNGHHQHDLVDPQHPVDTHYDQDAPADGWDEEDALEELNVDDSHGDDHNIDYEHQDSMDPPYQHEPPPEAISATDGWNEEDPALDEFNDHNDGEDQVVYENGPVDPQYEPEEEIAADGWNDEDALDELNEGDDPVEYNDGHLGYHEPEEAITADGWEEELNVDGSYREDRIDDDPAPTDAHADYQEEYHEPEEVITADGWEEELNVDDSHREDRIDDDPAPTDAHADFQEGHHEPEEVITALGWEEELNVDHSHREDRIDNVPTDDHADYQDGISVLNHEQNEPDEPIAADGWDEEDPLADVDVGDGALPSEEPVDNYAVDASEPPLVDANGGVTLGSNNDAVDLNDDAADQQPTPLDEEQDDIPVEAAEAHHTLQNALDDLHDQEANDGEDSTYSPSHLSDDALTDDEAHASAAVLEIQQEMDRMQAVRDQRETIESATPVVDHTPDWHVSEGNTTRSLLVTADDLTLEMGTVGHDPTDAAEVYADENEDEYGPVVDHLPPKPSHHRGNSVDAQAMSILTKDIYDDEAMDESCVSDGVWVDDEETVDQALKEEEHVVDLTPIDERRRVAADPSVGVLASEAGSTLHDPGDQDVPEDFGPVVDHTPTVLTSSSQHSATAGANSMAVNAAALAQDFQDYSVMDETYFGDSTVDDGRTTLGDGWDDDEGVDGDDDEQDEITDRDDDPPTPVSSSRRPPSTTIQQERHVVDHTPSEMPDSEQPVVHSDPSVLALVALEDMTRDTGEGNDETVYDDENEISYGQVVDHTPTTPAMSTAARSIMSTAAHASTMADDARTEFDDNTSAYGGQSTVGGDGGVSVLDGGVSVLDGGVSVLDGGVSVLAGTIDGVAGEGWDQDEVILDEEEEPVEEQPDLVDHTPPTPPSPSNVALVDQTPSEMGASRPAVADPSVEVAISDDQTKTSADGNDDFGPIVDQTPTTPATSTSLLREDSVVAQAALADLDTVDEETLPGGESVDDDDDTVDESFLSLRRLDSTLDRQVVDHVPNRPESRFGDASTAVAADPSEVLSEVDDMGLEDNFGPVVDLTPPNRPAAVSTGLPSAGGSTMGAGSEVAFAPGSVAADDLDHDETEAQGDGWDNDDEPELEEEPNPQSGNEEPLPALVEADNEQLVDFLPPQDVANEHVVREGLSVLTVGGGQSLVPAEEAKEDDFGPVVDQTPRAHPSAGQSHASTVSQVTMSEIRAMEKDDKAQEAEETSTDTEPTKPKVVVDHLPQMRDKIPADSLATVVRSELSDGDDEEDEDERFGPVVDHLPTPRLWAVSSRGGSTVDALATVSEVDSDEGGGDGDGWDEDADLDVSVGAVSDGTALLNAAATRAVFTRSTSTASEDRTMSVRFDSSVHESTVASISESNDRTFYFDAPNETSGTVNETQYFDTQDQSASAVAEDGWEDDGIVIDEDSVAVKDEGSFADADTPPSTPHRRGNPGNVAALEGLSDSLPLNGDDVEVPASKAFTNVTGTSCQTCADSKSVDCPCVKRLIQLNTANGGLIGKMTTPEGGIVQIDFNQLLQDEIVKRRLVEEQSKALRSSFGPQRLQEMKRLASQVVEMKESSQSSTKEIAHLRDECANLRLENGMLDEQLKESKTSITTLEGAKGDFTTREVDLTEQVKLLQLALDEARTQRLSSDTAELTTVRSSLETVKKEREELQSTLTSMSQNLKQSEEQKAAQSREFERCSTELHHSVSEVQTQLLNSERRLTETMTSSELAKKSYEEKCSALESRLSVQETENKSLLQQMAKSKVIYENSLREKSELMDTKLATIQNLEATVASLASEKSTLQEDLDRQLQVVVESKSLAASVRSLEDERAALQASLIESKEAVLSLQRHIDEHGMEEDARESKKDYEIDALRAELREVKASLECSEAENVGFAERLNLLTTKNESLQHQLADLDKSCHELKSKAMDSEANAALRTEELVSARKELDQVQADRMRIQTEHQKSTSHLAELGRALIRAEKNAQQFEQKTKELTEQLLGTESQVSSLRTERDAIADERGRSLEKCRTLEGEKARLLAEKEDRAPTASRDLEAEILALTLERDALLSQVASFGQISGELEEQRVKLLEALSERDVLAEENEEMLVQFGLLKEQMDASEEQVKLLQDEIGTMDTARSGAEDFHGDLDGLMESNSQLSAHVQQLQSQNVELREQIAASGAEIERLTKDLEVVSSYNEEYASQSDSMRTQLSQLVEERDTLYNRSHELSSNVDNLSSTISDLERHRVSSMEEIARHLRQEEELSSRAGQLSSQKTDLERQLAFVTEEKNRLTARVHFLEAQDGHATSWNEEKEHLVSVSNSLEERCRALDGECREKEVLLSETKEQMRHSAAEYQNHIAQLERACSERDQMIESKENTLMQLRESGGQELGECRSTMDAMRSKIAELEHNVRGLETNIYETNKKNGSLSLELETAREQAMIAMAESSRLREVELQHLTDEFESLKKANKAEVSRLSAESVSLRKELQSAKDTLARKEKEVKDASNELVTLRSQQRKDKASVADVLRTSPAELEDLDTMRSFVVSLAIALERSENRRAEAMDKLLTERQANTDSLRRLSESVKRFYSTVTFGDS